MIRKINFAFSPFWAPYCLCASFATTDLFLAEIIGSMARIDAFLAYNERESQVDLISDSLRQSGISAHFWRRDIAPGELIDETLQLQDAGVVVVFLGEHGWGKNHLRVVEEAQRMQRRVIPVVIGNFPSGAENAAGQLFKLRRYIDWRFPSLNPLAQLVAAIRSGPGGTDQAVVQNSDQQTQPVTATSPVTDSAGQVAGRNIGLLLHGSEAEREQALARIAALDEAGFRPVEPLLIECIRQHYQRYRTMSSSPEQDGPEGSASARSWLLSALSLGASRSDDVQAVLEQHASYAYEPDRIVRFWVLAQLHRNGPVSWWRRIMKSAAGDPAPEVALLAELHLSRSRNWANRLERSLLAPAFDECWAALRILRYFPEPSLAMVLFGRLLSFTHGETNIALAYDVICALQPRGIFSQVASLLQTHLDEVVDLVVRAFDASRAPSAQFVSFIAALERPALAAQLNRIARDPRHATAVTRLHQLLMLRDRNQSAQSHQTPGYNSDQINESDDKLDIAQDVQGLTAIIASRDVVPPLAIGLFGPWGSGKSFFMRAMRRQIEALARKAREKKQSSYCSHVVQIEFNAWHYVDTNLWASLVAHIFKQLSRVVTPGESPEQRQAALLVKLEQARQKTDSAQVERQSSSDLLREETEKLEKLRRARKERDIQLRELSGDDLKSLLGGSAAAGQVEQALEKLGIPKTLGSLADFRKIVSEAYSLKGRTTALLSALAATRWTWRRVALLLAMLGVPLLVAGILIHYQPSQQFLAQVGVLLAEFVAILTMVGKAIRAGTEKVSAALEIVEQARQKVEAIYAAKHSEPSQEETDTASRISALEGKIKAADQAVEEGKKAAETAQQEMEVLRESTSLARFLSDRSGAEDYRKHLGLISTVRQDFELLDERLKTAAAENSGQQKVERIVLYIDDLDRCPADKVVDVLQAVHLLLAYRLFVVVVGVDARWLLHSLSSRYEAFENKPGGSAFHPSQWSTTPQHYLEKIFQIPFNLRAMTPQGYGRLIGGLLSQADLPAPAAAAVSVKDPVNRPQDSAGTTATTAATAIVVSTAEAETGAGAAALPDRMGSPTVSPGADSTAMPQVHPAGTDMAETPELDFEIAEASLIIQPWEAAYAATLYPLIPSPRAAKRLTNVYRLLKTRVAQRDLPQFEGSATEPGQFQLPMLLLAIVIHSPQWAARQLPRIHSQWESFGDITVAFASMVTASSADDARVSQEVSSTVSALVAAEFFPDEVSLLRDWIPLVARFSFEMNSLIK